jgi:hypothetical protein
VVAQEDRVQAAAEQVAQLRQQLLLQRFLILERLLLLQESLDMRLAVALLHQVLQALPLLVFQVVAVVVVLVHREL